MRKFVILVFVLVLLVVPFTVSAAPPTHAHVHFGDENAGSPFPPDHDRSFHATDKMVPRTVVISQGGSVTFNTTPPHQIAIYKPGTLPEDINLHPDFLEDLVLPSPPFPPNTIIPDILIDDPVGRVVLGPDPDFFGHVEWTTPAGTFDEPGRYLVICTILPHFAEADMYGWVIVK
jgi:plastocyanin